MLKVLANLFKKSMPGGQSEYEAIIAAETAKEKERLTAMSRDELLHYAAETNVCLKSAFTQIEVLASYCETFAEGQEKLAETVKSLVEKRYKKA